MNLLPLYPEICLLLSALLILILDLYLKDDQRNLTHWLSVVALGATALISYDYLRAGETVYAFNNMFVTDALSNLLKVLTLVAVMVTLCYGRLYTQQRDMFKGEYYVLALLATLGQMVMISANNLLTIYLGLELLSLSLYALVAIRRDTLACTEAAMKYFVLGALASGFLLYGMSMLYGATGSLDIGTINKAVTTIAPDNKMILVFALVFIVAGLAFKLGVVPFHMWVPDVYQGSPTAVTLLLSAAPKFAAFAITLRLLVEGMLPLAKDWQQMLMVLAVLSIGLGNLVAIAQKNIKRMLAYSTISHMGFMLLGLLSGVVNGNTFSASEAYSSALFYIVIYVLTTLGSFGILLLLARAGIEIEQIDDLKGLGKRHFGYAIVLLLLMFSLAGVPPTVGFYAKLVVLKATMNAGHIWLAILAVLFSLVGAFYYLRVVKVVFFDEPSDTEPLQASADARLILGVNGAAVLIFGLLPSGLLSLCGWVIVRTLAS
ncbi:NADH-quinone oxidoreductase subunit NuoN [Parvibium lacunae]|uniref:NADH-quinone oxidoreductase subunit N n=1 Tax=Parvibium lacunae TaxID=1888893 RepID=A0A368L504_9BURK|nr:NADH-quinone oxidoreductase subunit NuoN [Parvibium lacunae]RCS58676.1 NADH-quinone oxidoreductase subunit NuoN [Parvibium lacunae]